MDPTDPNPKTTQPPPDQPQPELKKPRISTTTTTSDTDNPPTTTTDPTRKPRYKRRKIAIFFAYCGVGYQGMQKNPGAKTIEGDLEEALFLSGAVPEPDRGNPKRYDWARSARTDKGVSAVGQVVSGRFYIDPPGLVQRLNSNLASQIRIFGFKRVTASFNAKKFCDRRRYVYLFPVFALDPCSHRHRESALGSLESGNELVECLECSERGRKVVGVAGRPGFEVRSHREISSNIEEALLSPEFKENGGGGGVPMDNSVEAKNVESKDDKCDVSLKIEEALVSPEFKENGGGVAVVDAIDNSVEANNVDFKGDSDVSLRVEDVKENDSAKNMDSEGVGVEPEIGVEDSVLVGENVCDGNGEEKLRNGREFCYGEEERERFNGILKCYVGTHNFHNFTTRTTAEDPSARRYIVSFEAKTTVTVDGIKFVKCEVVGQSFMLHQIRKMIGLAIAIMRNCAPQSLIEQALRKDARINVPTAPEVGLYLDECLFASYNQKWKDSHEELSMKAYEEEAEEFKMNHIYSHIAATEHKEGVVGLWLHSLNHWNYPDLRVSGDSDGASDGRSVQLPNP